MTRFCCNAIGLGVIPLLLFSCDLESKLIQCPLVFGCQPILLRRLPLIGCLRLLIHSLGNWSLDLNWLRCCLSRLVLDPVTNDRT